MSSVLRPRRLLVHAALRNDSKRERRRGSAHRSNREVHVRTLRPKSETALQRAGTASVLLRCDARSDEALRQCLGAADQGQHRTGISRGVAERTRHALTFITRGAACAAASNENSMRTSLDTSTDPQVGFRPPGKLDIATALDRYRGPFGKRQAAHLARRTGSTRATLTSSFPPTRIPRSCTIRKFATGSPNFGGSTACCAPSIRWSR